MQTLRRWWDKEVSILWPIVLLGIVLFFIPDIMEQLGLCGNPDRTGQCVESVEVKSFGRQPVVGYLGIAIRDIKPGVEVPLLTESGRFLCDDSGIVRITVVFVKDDYIYYALETDTTWTDCNSLTQELWDRRTR